MPEPVYKEGSTQGLTRNSAYTPGRLDLIGRIVMLGAAMIVIDTDLAKELSLPVMGKTELQSPAAGTPT